MITADIGSLKLAHRIGNVCVACGIYRRFFFNLYTCSAGSQVTGTLGVSPPTVYEYLYSVNHNLLIDIPADETEEEFNAENVFYIE